MKNALIIGAGAALALEMYLRATTGKGILPKLTGSDESAQAPATATTPPTSSAFVPSALSDAASLSTGASSVAIPFRPLNANSDVFSRGS